MENKQCPQPRTLCQFAEAELNDGDAENVILHLEDCEYCRRIVESFARLPLANAAADDSGDQQVIDSVVRKVIDGGLYETVIKDSHDASPPAPHPDGHVLLSTLDSQGSVDRYQLTRLHASGGMGRVWLARDSAIGRDVALKELLPERADDPQIWARFLNEARVTGRLEHPGIVPVYEVNEPESSKPFYTMRFVKGQTLHDAARAFQKMRDGDEGVLQLRSLVSSVIGVCNAVAYAHSRGVLHRDLKGRNIVLGDFGEVIVLDWGLASTYANEAKEEEEDEPVLPSTTGHQSVDGQIVGTPRFMAPEQATGDRGQLSPATDVYGLGAVLYEILTGGPPIDGDSSEEILQNIMFTPPSSPRQRWPAVPRPLESICLKALSKQPEDRYSTPIELASDLQRWLADQSVSAYRDPFTVRLGRWARHHRTLVASTLVLLCTAVTALTISTVAIAAEQSRTTIAKERAERNLNRAREAVDSMLTRVGHERLRNVPQMELLRRDLLEEAVRFNEELLEDSDQPDLRQEAAAAHRRAAAIYQMLGQTDDAMKSLASAEALLKLVEGTNDSALEFQKGETNALAAALIGSKGDHVSASQEAETAILHFERHQASSATATVRETMALANAWMLLADTQRLSGRTGTAQDSLKEAIAILTTKLTGSRQARIAEVDARTRLADLLTLDSRISGAGAEFAKAIALGRELLVEFPSDADVAENMARTVRGYAALLKLNNDRKTALAVLAEGLDVHQRLSNDYPHVTAYRRAYSDCLSQLASLYATSGQRDLAGEMLLRAHDEAVSLANDFPDLVAHQLSAAATAEAMGAFYAAERRDADSQNVLSAATERMRQLPQTFRDSPEIQGRHAGLVKAYADVAARNEEYELALQLANEYVSILERLTDLPNPPAEVRNELAKGYRLLSAMHAEVDHPLEAMEWLTKAVDTHRGLVRDHPEIGEYSRQLAASLSGKARRLLQSQNAEQARELHAEAQRLRQAIHDREPTRTDAQASLAAGHRYMAIIATAERNWELADEELNTAMKLLIDLQARDSVSDLFNQVALTHLARTDLRLSQNQLAEAFEPLDQAIQIYRDEHETRPELKHATRGLYRFLRRKADIRIRMNDYTRAKQSILEAEELTLDEEWGNPYEIAMLLCRSIPLIDETAGFSEEQAAEEKRELATLAMKNLRTAIESDCPAEEILDIKPELDVLNFVPEYATLLKELEAARDPNRLWKHADDPSVLKPRRP